MSRSLQMVGAAVAGGLVVGLIMWVARPAPTATPAVPTSAAVAPVDVVAPATPASTVAPPWADTGAGTAAGLPVVNAANTAPASPEKKAAREAVRQKIAALTANGRQPTPAEMNVVLADLERVEGSSTISGINVGAVRNNLMKVDEMQRLAEQMKAEASKPGGGDQQKMNAMMVRIQKLQSEMRLDIAVPPSANPVQSTQK